MTRLNLLFLSIICVSISYGQKMGKYYVSIPIDSSSGCRLRFLNDTMVELSTVPRHMSRGLIGVFKCKISDTTVDIFPELSSTDSLGLTSYRLEYFMRTIVSLTKVRSGFINYSKSLIYVLERRLDKNQHLTVIIDGKKFIQPTGHANGYGMIDKVLKNNKTLHRTLNYIEKSISSMEFFKGFDAYRRFGLKGVYGTIVITTKNS